jgi:hypothetical protein
MTLRTSHLMAIGLFLAGSGVVHGIWSSRWAEVTSQEKSQQMLQVDEIAGGWKPGEFFTIDPAELPKNTKCASRRFTHPSSNKNVVVSITSGHPGVVAVHTPDVCYLGTGYQIKTTVKKEEIVIDSNGTKAYFYCADFQKGNESLRVRWAWGVDGNWQAPNSPRWHFIREPLLYKLYIVHPLTEDEDLTKDDPYRKFLADLVPSLNRQFVH